MPTQHQSPRKSHSFASYELSEDLKELLYYTRIEKETLLDAMLLKKLVSYSRIVLLSLDAKNYMVADRFLLKVRDIASELNNSSDFTEYKSFGQYRRIEALTLIKTIRTRLIDYYSMDY